MGIITAFLIFMVKAWALAFMLTCVYGFLRWWVVVREERKIRDKASYEFLHRGHDEP